MLTFNWPKDNFFPEKNIVSTTVYTWRGAMLYKRPEGGQHLYQTNVSVCLDGSIAMIPAFSMEEWLEAAEYIGKEQKKIIKCSMYESVPMCGHCFGSGKIDWVRRVKNKPNRRPIVFGDPEYIAFFPSEKLSKAKDGMRVQYLPKLLDEEKYCFSCGALGIAFQDYSRIFDNKLWYQTKFPTEE